MMGKEQTSAPRAAVKPPDMGQSDDVNSAYVAYREAHGNGGNPGGNVVGLGVDDYAAVCEAAMEADGPSKIIPPGGRKLPLRKSLAGRNSRFCI